MKKILVFIATILALFFIAVTAKAQVKINQAPPTPGILYGSVDQFESADTTGIVHDGYFYGERKKQGKKIGWNIAASVTNRKAAEATTGPLWYYRNQSFGPLAGYDVDDKLHIGIQYSWSNTDKGWNSYATSEVSYQKSSKPFYWYYAFATKTLGKHLIVGGMLRQAYGVGLTEGWSLTKNISLNIVEFYDYEDVDSNGHPFKFALNLKAKFE